MVPTTRPKKSVGDSSGMVTRQNMVQAPAPSRRAASRISSGNDCSPAVMMMNESPRNCHTAMRATAGSAHVGFPRMAGWGSKPSHGSRPTTGSISVPNTTAATATEVTTVEEKINR